jgi:hypothetical protein
MDVSVQVYREEKDRDKWGKMGRRQGYRNSKRLIFLIVDTSSLLIVFAVALIFRRILVYS